MAIDIKSRSIDRFRTQIDPMIPPKPRNSFDKRELKNWIMELTPAGVYVKCFNTIPGGKTHSEEHLVPFANIQSIKFEDEKTDEKKAKE